MNVMYHSNQLKPFIDKFGKDLFEIACRIRYADNRVHLIFPYEPKRRETEVDCDSCGARHALNFDWNCKIGSAAGQGQSVTPYKQRIWKTHHTCHFYGSEHWNALRHFISCPFLDAKATTPVFHYANVDDCFMERVLSREDFIKCLKEACRLEDELRPIRNAVQHGWDFSVSRGVIGQDYEVWLGATQYIRNKKEELPLDSSEMRYYMESARQLSLAVDFWFPPHHPMVPVIPQININLKEHAQVHPNHHHQNWQPRAPQQRRRQARLASPIQPIVTNQTDKTRPNKPPAQTPKETRPFPNDPYPQDPA